MHCDISRYVKVLLNGKLYICERGARLNQLGKYTSEHDYVELINTDSQEILKEKIKRIYYADYADVCDYCDRGSFPIKKIKGGEQLRGQLQSSEYTIVHREEYESLKKKVQELELYEACGK